MEKILIEAVKVRPSLYNVNCMEYKDAKIRDKEWKEVAALVGESLEKCKNRWKSLRRKARIEMLKPIHKATKITKDWQYLDSLSFLKNNINLNRTYTGSEEGSKDQPILRAALCNNDLFNKTIGLNIEGKNLINKSSTYNHSTDINTMGEIENSINDSSIYNTPSTISQYEVLEISNESNEVPRPPTLRTLSFNNMELSKENIDSINTSPTYSTTFNISSRLINDKKNSIFESQIHNNPSIMTTFDILEISDDSTDGQDILQAPLLNNDLSETINAFSTFNSPYDTSIRNEKRKMRNSIDKFPIYDYPPTKRLRYDNINSTNESPIHNRNVHNTNSTNTNTNESPIYNKPSDFNKQPKHGNKNSSIGIAQSYNKSLELENKSKDSSEKSTIQSFFKSLGVILKENLNYDEEIEMEEAILATVEQKIKEFKIRKGEIQNAE